MVTCEVTAKLLYLRSACFGVKTNICTHLSPLSIITYFLLEQFSNAHCLRYKSQRFFNQTVRSGFTYNYNNVARRVLFGHLEVFTQAIFYILLFIFVSLTGQVIVVPFLLFVSFSFLIDTCCTKAMRYYTTQYNKFIE